MVMTTPRLRLRPFTAADAPAFYDYARDPRVGIAAGWRPHRSVEETRRIILEVMTGDHIFAVEERDSGLLVGSAGFTGRNRGQCPGPSDEIGYSFRPDRWGRGYATEAVRALLGHGFLFLSIAFSQMQGPKAVICIAALLLCALGNIALSVRELRLGRRSTP